jgi:hypothetical protein
MEHCQHCQRRMPLPNATLALKAASSVAEQTRTNLHLLCEGKLPSLRRPQIHASYFLLAQYQGLFNWGLVRRIWHSLARQRPLHKRNGSRQGGKNLCMNSVQAQRVKTGEKELVYQ